MSEICEQGSASSGRKKVSWRRDPVILARLPRVERLHFAGRSNIAIAAELDVAEATIRNDLKRLQELWLERTAGTQAEIRARVISELADIKGRAIAAAEFDEQAERAVLYGDSIDDDDPNSPVGGRKVYRDDKGSATFRGQKAQALNVARQATMDIAKVSGVVVDKVAPTDSDGNTLPLEELMARYARAHDQQTDARS